jgi:endonuclease YncB( thermonuclease family)
MALDLTLGVASPNRRIVSSTGSYWRKSYHQEMRGEKMECRAFVIAALIVGALALPATAQRVIDGDTIDLNSPRYRVWGHYLRQLMATAPVRCEDRGHDRYRRTIGLCRAGGSFARFP